MNLNRDKIKARLEKMPREKCVVLALRSALRILPLLAVQKKYKQRFWQKKVKRDVFYYWEKDKTEYLLAVHRAYSISFEYLWSGNFSLTPAVHAYVWAAVERSRDHGGTTATYIIDAACAITKATAATYAATSAIAAAYVATDAATADLATIEVDVETHLVCITNYLASYTAVDTVVNSTYYAVADVILAARDIDCANIIKEIEYDLTQLENLSSINVLEQPLWVNNMPVDLQQLHEEFKQDTLSLNAGFEVWLDWYEERIQGKAINSELLRKWNNIPSEIQRQGAVKVNAYLKNIIEHEVILPLKHMH